MRKLRIYLDTSVISGLDQQDDPTRMRDTRDLWELAKVGRFDIVVSNLTMAEIDSAQQEKADTLKARLLEVEFSLVARNSESQRLAALYIERRGLPPKSFDDAAHIAIATVSECDVILSWNFRHIVNSRATAVVNSVNIEEGYRRLEILPPPMLLDWREHHHGLEQI